jgi:hypothetical protein
MSAAKSFNEKLVKFLRAYDAAVPTEMPCVREELRRCETAAQDAPTVAAEWVADWSDADALPAFCSALCSAEPAWGALQRTPSRLLHRIAFVNTLRAAGWSMEERGIITRHLRGLDEMAQLWKSSVSATAADSMAMVVAVPGGDGDGDEDCDGTDADADSSSGESGGAEPLDPRRSMPHAFCKLLKQLLQQLCSSFPYSTVPHVHKWLQTLKRTVLGNADAEAAAIKEWHQEMTLEPNVDPDSHVETPRATSLYKVTKLRDVDTLLCAHLWPVNEMLYDHLPVVALFNDERLDREALFATLDHLNAVAHLYNSLPPSLMDIAGSVTSGIELTQCKGPEAVMSVTQQLISRGMDFLQSPDSIDQVMKLIPGMMATVEEDGEGLAESLRMFVNPTSCEKLGIDTATVMQTISQMGAAHPDTAANVPAFLAAASTFGFGGMGASPSAGAGGRADE